MSRDEREGANEEHDDADEEWEFGVEDVSPDPGGDPHDPGPIEAGDPTPENVLFFVLGTLAALFAFYAFLF